jgi:DNA-binding response OmpR family regulator
MVLEGDPAQVDQLDRLLVGYGVEVEVCDASLSGLAQAKASPPELLIVSVGEGDASGFRLCREARRSPELAGVPIFLLSSGFGREVLEEHSRLKSRADGYFEKPLSGEALWSLASAWLSGPGAPMALVGPGARVLLAGAGEETEAALRPALEARGCVVEVVRRGEEALSGAKARRPDLVVVGAALEDMSGFRLCWSLRRAGPLGELPLFLIVEGVEGEVLEEHSQLRSRADAYFLKPFDVGDVLGEVATFLPVASL